MNSTQNDITNSSNAAATLTGLWQLDSGRKLLSRSSSGGSGFGARRVAFDPNGKLWARASGNKFEINDISSLQTTVSLAIDTGEVRAVTFTPDGRSLLVFSSDWTLRSYPIALKDLMAWARSRLQRDWTAEQRERYLHGPRKK